MALLGTLHSNGDMRAIPFIETKDSTVIAILLV